MNVKVVNTSTNLLPVPATSWSAGLDIQALIPEPIELYPLERAMVPTGLFIEIPRGYEMQVRPRSGLAAKYGITVLNTPGTIDADYRGEVKVILINLSNHPYTISNGDRIAQILLKPIYPFEWEPVTELEPSDRGEKGFGSTGS